MHFPPAFRFFPAPVIPSSRTLGAARNLRAAPRVSGSFAIREDGFFTEIRYLCGVLLYKPRAIYYNTTMIALADGWKEYSVIATGGGYKLERWKDIYLLRPDPQVIWEARRDLFSDPRIDAVYRRNERGGGSWELRRTLPESWNISYRDLGVQAHGALSRTGVPLGQDGGSRKERGP